VLELEERPSLNNKDTVGRSCSVQAIIEGHVLVSGAGVPRVHCVEPREYGHAKKALKESGLGFCDVPHRLGMGISMCLYVYLHPS